MLKTCACWVLAIKAQKPSLHVCNRAGFPVTTLVVSAVLLSKDKLYKAAHLFEPVSPAVDLS